MCADFDTGHRDIPLYQWWFIRLKCIELSYNYKLYAQEAQENLLMLYIAINWYRYLCLNSAMLQLNNNTFNFKYFLLWNTPCNKVKRIVGNSLQFRSHVVVVTSWLDRITQPCTGMEIKTRLSSTCTSHDIALIDCP